MTHMVTIPSDEYDELHRLRIEVRLFREGIATLQRELEQERKRLDWLEGEQGSGLISDDDKHWAVSSFGMQNVPEETPADIWTSFHVEKHEWHTNIREAIDAAIAQAEGGRE